MHESDQPIRLAIVNDYPVIVAGVADLLAPYDSRVSVVHLDAGILTPGQVDVVLYDTFGKAADDDLYLRDLTAGGHARVIVFTWAARVPTIRRELADAVSGFLFKGVAASDMVTAIETVHAGGRIPALPDQVTPDGRPRAVPDAWPGRELGLSNRESEMISLITQGLTNQQIAESVYLSINSVKTYVRTAYRKIGVGSRAEAVRFGIHHGFEPHRTSAWK